MRFNIRGSSLARGVVMMTTSLAMLALSALPSTVRAARIHDNCSTTGSIYNVGGPTALIQNKIRDGAIVSAILVKRGTAPWATSQAVPTRGTYVSYVIDWGATLYISPLGDAWTILRTSRLKPGIHRLAIALNDGGHVIERQIFCLTVTR